VWTQYGDRHYFTDAGLEVLGLDRHNYTVLRPIQMSLSEPQVAEVWHLSPKHGMERTEELLPPSGYSPQLYYVYPYSVGHDGEIVTVVSQGYPGAPNFFYNTEAKPPYFLESDVTVFNARNGYHFGEFWTGADGYQKLTGPGGLEVEIDRSFLLEHGVNVAPSDFYGLIRNAVLGPMGKLYGMTSDASKPFCYDSSSDTITSVPQLVSAAADNGWTAGQTVLWNETSGITIDLSRLLQPEWDLEQILDINNRGQVLCLATPHNDSSTATEAVTPRLLFVDLED
jgi:hypothetical protein